MLLGDAGVGGVGNGGSGSLSKESPPCVSPRSQGEQKPCKQRQNKATEEESKTNQRRNLIPWPNRNPGNRAVNRQV